MNSLFAYLEDIYAPVDGERESFALEKHTIGENTQRLGRKFCTKTLIHRESQMDYTIGLMVMEWFMVSNFKTVQQNTEIDMFKRKEDGQNYNRDKNLWRGILEPIDFDNPLGTDKDTANTDLVYHNGKLLAMWWLSGTPYSLDPKTFATQKQRNL